MNNQRTLVNIDQSVQAYLDDLRRDIFLNLKCHDIAKVIEVDTAKQTLKCEINYKRTMMRPNTTKQSTKSRERFEYIPRQEEYPVLIDVPFIVMRASSTVYLNIPISVGQNVMVLYNDRCIDDWYASGQQSNLSSPRLHSMADAVALVGIASMKDLIVGYDASRIGMVNDKAMVMVGEKIEVKNDLQSLGPVLQELIGKLNELTTQVTAITVPYTDDGSPAVSGVPVNAAAITAIGNQITAIGTKLGQVIL